ncbi:MAG TPA: OmpA family protein [Gemmatimonadaceae bacterium]|nr:OmpA family protein [Gemmatimonadaceae bacterium]
MRRILMVAAAALVAACATTRRPAALTQAEGILRQLESTGAEQRVEGQLYKTRDAVAAANRAVDDRSTQAYVDDLAQIALRRAQTAQAEDARLAAERQADSLRTARLTMLLSMSEAQRLALREAQQLSQEEIAQLQQRNMLTEQRADSLASVAAEAQAQLNAAMDRLRTLVVEITNLRETTRGLVVSLSDVLFDVDKATLRAGSQQKMQQIATVLNQYPDYQIAVEGHTDATGTDAYNQRLSDQRAAAVREALVAGGVPASRITSRGYGESQPVTSNDSPAGRQQNRRVEVVVLGAGSLAGGAGGTPGMTRPDSTARPDSTSRR